MIRDVRPAELNDARWLAEHYETRSAAQIARELDINPQMVLAALRRHGVPIRSKRDEQRRRNPLLHDRAALEERVAATSVALVADELSVTVIAVQKALARQGGNSAHRYNGKTPIPPPSDLGHTWDEERTVRGVARRHGVSHNTAAVWLAQNGIYINDTPAISRTDLESAIADGDPIDVIRRRHHVTGRTVIVELHRHGLFDAHRRRHM